MSSLLAPDACPSGLGNCRECELGTPDSEELRYRPGLPHVGVFIRSGSIR